MTNKQAIEQLDQMIAEYLAKNDPAELTKRIKEKFGRLAQSGVSEELKKSVQNLEEELNKASGVNLTYMSEKKSGKSLKKLDPKTKLRGNLIDKVETADVGAGSMGSSGMNLTPQGVTSGLGKPSTIGAPMESGRGKNVNKTKKSEELGKAVKNGWVKDKRGTHWIEHGPISASVEPSKDSNYHRIEIGHTGLGHLERLSHKGDLESAKQKASNRAKELRDIHKSELNKMSPDDSAPIPMSASERDPRLASRLKKCLVRKTLTAAENPDEKSDADLGEKVEKLVEGHFKNNKEAERKEGHHLVYKDEKGVHPKFQPKESYKNRGVSIAGFLHRYTNGKSKDLNNVTKEHHKEVLQDLKNMPKPNLPKSEKMGKADGNPGHRTQNGYERGVHLQSHGPGMHEGESRTNAMIRSSKSPLLNHSDHIKQARYAKEQHHKKLEELKSMPKPNLPKSEKPESWLRYEKGVNSPQAGRRDNVKSSGKGGLSGGSVAGGAIRSGKDTLSYKWGKDQHRKVLNELKSMPKPNLPKSEKHISEKDPVLGSHPIPKAASKDYEKKSKAYLASKPIKKVSDQCRRIFEHLQKKAIEGVPPSSEPKDMTPSTKRAIREPADKPFKIQPHREGQANKPVQKAELQKKHVGFKAVEEKAREEGAKDPGGVAYAVGEKKYGKKGMAEKAAAGKKKATKKSEVLNKPYHSDAQRRWAHTKNGEKALGGKKAVHEWDEASKGKKLPEKVKKD